MQRRQGRRQEDPRRGQPREEEHLRALQSLVVARERVGSTPDSQLAWLADFAQRDLTDEASHQRTRMEVVAFWEHVLIMPQPDRQFATILDYGLGWSAGVQSVDDLTQAQSQIRECLDHLKMTGLIFPVVALNALNAITALPTGRADGRKIVL